MPIVAGVSFRRAGKIYHFDPGELALKAGDHVVVETMRGIELGRICTDLKELDAREIASPLKKIIRKATQEDYDKFLENKLNAVKSFKICTEKIETHKLPMKLVDVEYTLDGSKVIFYFSAEGRIDFRNLVRDLAAVFKKRIELHQIGVRDEAKMIGGIGPCGLPVCCATFMKEFDPVSIKMAKEQNLSLNPERISGTCGRLMCCLRHEFDFYHETAKDMPEQGSNVEVPEGSGIVVDVSIPKRTVVVELSSKARVEVPVDKIILIKREPKCKESKEGECSKCGIAKAEERGQRREERGRRTEERGRRTEERGERREDGGQKTEDGGQRTEDGGQRTEERGDDSDF